LGANEKRSNQQDVIAVSNVQHNCHAGKCSIAWIRTLHVERNDNGTKGAEIKHNNDVHYVVNDATFSMFGAHRSFSDIPCFPGGRQRQLTALHKGIAKWHGKETPAGPRVIFWQWVPVWPIKILCFNCYHVLSLSLCTITLLMFNTCIQ
jgi:hypothetical protein